MLVGAFNQEKTIVGAFSVIVKTDGSFAALFLGHSANLHHHQIYLHERGQFWPNENIPHLVRWKQKPNVLTKIFFQVVKYDKVSKSNFKK